MSLSRSVESLRLAVYHAALRTRLLTAGQGDVSVIGRELCALLGQEGHQIEALPGSTETMAYLLVNQVVVLQVVTTAATGDVERPALDQYLREHARAFGLLLDFRKPLLLDGLVESTSGPLEPVSVMEESA